MNTQRKNTFLCVIAVSFFSKHAGSIPIMNPQTASVLHHPSATNHEFEFLTAPILTYMGDSLPPSTGATGKAGDAFNRDYGNSHNIPPTAPRYNREENKRRSPKTTRTTNTHNHIHPQFEQGFVEPEAYIPHTRIPRREDLQPSLDNGQARHQEDPHQTNPQRLVRTVIEPLHSSQHGNYYAHNHENQNDINHGEDHVCIRGVCRWLPGPYLESSVRTRNHNLKADGQRKRTGEAKEHSNHFDMRIVRSRPEVNSANEQPAAERDAEQLQPPFHLYSLHHNLPLQAEPIKGLEKNPGNPPHRGHEFLQNKPVNMMKYPNSAWEYKSLDLGKSHPSIPSGSGLIPGLLVIEMDVSEAHDTYETKLETEEDISLSP